MLCMQMCDYVRDDLASGGRTYFIFPRIESKSVPNAKTVKSEHPKYVESGVLGPNVSIENDTWPAQCFRAE